MVVVVLMKLEHHTLMRTVLYIMDIHVLAREYHIFFSINFGIFSIFLFSYLVMKCGDILDIIITICLWFSQEFFCCYSMYYIIYFVMLKMHDLQSFFWIQSIPWVPIFKSYYSFCANDLLLLILYVVYALSLYFACFHWCPLFSLQDNSSTSIFCFWEGFHWHSWLCWKYVTICADK
jgi:hypothetical protein